MIEELRNQMKTLQEDFNQVKVTTAITKQEMQNYWEESRESRKEMMDTVKDLSHAVHDVKNDLESFRESTKSLVETFAALQGLVNVLLWIGTVIKPLAVVAVAITSIVLYFQGSKLPFIGK